MNTTSRRKLLMEHVDSSKYSGNLPVELAKTAEFTAERRSITETHGGASLMPPTAAWSRREPRPKPPHGSKAVCVWVLGTTSTGPHCGPYQRRTQNVGITPRPSRVFVIHRRSAVNVTDIGALDSRTGARRHVSQIS